MKRYRIVRSAPPPHSARVIYFYELGGAQLAALDYARRDGANVDVEGVDDLFGGFRSLYVAHPGVTA